MATDNLSTSVATTYADDVSDPSVAQHQSDHDRIHRVVNIAQVVVRWVPGSGWETVRPAWAPWGVGFNAQNDPAATVPPGTGYQVGDYMDCHPDSPLLPQNQ